MGVETLSAEQRASNGFELMDSVGPEDWRERIEPDLLDINHGYFCVLGQVYAEEGHGQGYEYALSHLDFLGSGNALEFFGLYDLNEEDAAALNKAWRALLAGEAEPLKGPVVHEEDQVKEDECGYQAAYGLPWSEYCVYPKGHGMDFCPGHERDVHEQYGRSA
ncbi:hypothetical protein [Streptomyces sp. CB03238]|uniref:hypothetical protein n=1 Tax=Streptomyces sp. CB03238 TaxID=1907777 RepID=UPI000A106446|nr:hypothetical protein [Streptomyces sp. CB03238]ORT58116.1 hypothetical protein BKD26_19570 [Streptomyces sp. CB03238]